MLYTVSNQEYKSNSLLTNNINSNNNNNNDNNKHKLNANVNANANAIPYPNKDNTAPIRFYLDTTFLDEDPGYSCYFFGQVVRVNSVNYTCTASDVLSDSSEGYIRRILIPSARDMMQSLFSVIPVDGPLFLQSGRCGFQGGVPIPQSYTRAGVGLFSADIVVFVTARPVLTPHVLAFAGQCQEDQIGRSIAGHLNINPSEVDVSPYAHEAQLGIVMHELTHVLGFSFGKFSSFHSPTYKLGYSYITNDALAHGQTETIAVINTPRVQAFVREHFGCSNMEGAPLENGGGPGTRLSHWEKRVFMNEYMTGEATHNPVISPLTLSLFEDSGWYMVNYSHSFNLIWGKGRGCDFVSKICTSWPTEGGFSCQGSESMCTFDMTAKGECNTYNFKEELPLGNQYFSSSKRGGRDSLADYCPYISPSSTWCDDETNSDIPIVIDSGENYCPTCRCFTSSLIREFPFGGTKRLGCYRSECAGPSDMRVMVGKLWYACTPNATIYVEGYGGHIYCPSLTQITAVCTNNSRQEFSIWPSITSISPTFGSPGSKVTITGSGFIKENIKSVIMHKECTNVTVLNNSTIIATLPDYDQLGNPAHLLAIRVIVVVMDNQGRTGLGYNMFEIRASDDIRFYIYMIVWLLSHWPAILSVLGAIGAAYYVKNARKRELQYHLQRSESYVQADYNIDN